MSRLLHEILEAKKNALARQKRRLPQAELERQALQTREGASFLRALTRSKDLAVIAEMKKRSPSAGLILEHYSPARIARIYEKNGARALSVLTEENYFHGSAEDLAAAALTSALPILRKDFIVEPYQIYEARRLGASAVLLIMGILSPPLYAELLALVHSLKMDALVEVHSALEMENALREKPRIVGINNRDLDNLSVDVDTTFRLLKLVPKNTAVVSESGIHSPQTISELRAAGVRAALIGESILKSDSLSRTLKAFVKAGQAPQR